MYFFCLTSEEAVAGEARVRFSRAEGTVVEAGLTRHLLHPDRVSFRFESHPQLKLLANLASIPKTMVASSFAVKTTPNFGLRERRPNTSLILDLVVRAETLIILDRGYSKRTLDLQQNMNIPLITKCCFRSPPD